MSNEEIKSYAKQHKVRMYELATEFEMNESVLSRLFRYELDEDMKQAIISTIDRLAAEKEAGGAGAKKLSVPSLMRERVLNKAKVQDKSSTSSMKATSTIAVEDMKTNGTAFTSDLFDDLLEEAGLRMKDGTSND